MLAQVARASESALCWWLLAALWLATAGTMGEVALGLGNVLVGCAMLGVDESDNRLARHAANGSSARETGLHSHAPDRAA